MSPRGKGSGTASHDLVRMTPWTWFGGWRGISPLCSLSLLAGSCWCADGGIDQRNLPGGFGHSLHRREGSVRALAVNKREPVATGREKPQVKQVLQVALIVKDLRRTMQRYWELFGIGPWSIRTYRPPDCTDTYVRGKPAPYTIRLASARIGDVEWELVQPLTGQSPYQEFLDTHGEGLHHVKFAVGDFDDTVAALALEGIGILNEGNYLGKRFIYFDTCKDLGAPIEIVKLPESPEWVPSPPEEIWPSAEGN